MFSKLQSAAVICNFFVIIFRFFSIPFSLTEPVFFSISCSFFIIFFRFFSIPEPVFFFFSEIAQLFSKLICPTQAETFSGFQSGAQTSPDSEFSRRRKRGTARGEISRSPNPRDRPYVDRHEIFFRPESGLLPRNTRANLFRPTSTL